MTPNKQRRKGDDWEREFRELLEKRLNAEAKRIPGSGSLGTALDEPMLQGDVRAKFPGLSKEFRFENKVGYGGSKQLTIKREWFDKIREEAERTFSIPAVACKFSGARKEGGTKYFISLDLDAFVEIINYINDLMEELDSLYEERN
jgi:Holliday junction resolvase